MGLVTFFLLTSFQTQAAIPSNDGFSSPKLIAGRTGTVVDSNAEATAEPGEPNHADIPANHSVWYTWHCSSGGTFDVRIAEASFSYVVAVYSGKTLDALTPLASAKNTSVSVDLVPGMVYLIAVDAAENLGGTFSLQWEQTFLINGGPDLFVPDRLLNPKIVDQSFADSDCEVEEHCTVQGRRRLLRFDMHTQNLGNEDLIFGPPGDSPLFQYAPCHNHYHFQALAIYRVLTISNVLVRVGNKFGFCLEDVLNVVAPANSTRRFNCNDQGIQAGWGDIYNADLPCQYVDLTGLPSGEYILEVELDPLHQIPESNEDNNIARTTFVLADPCTGRPANDDFQNAQPLVGDIVTVLGDSSCATRQTGEPQHLFTAGNEASKSLWYTWTATTTGPVVVSTEGSAFETVLAVYVGNTLGILNDNRIAEAGALSDLVKQSRLSFNAVANTKYQIAVDGFNLGVGAQAGAVVLNINPAGNDDFADCQGLSGGSGSVLGYIVNATSETGEPLHAGQPGGTSLWYCWTAPTSGAYYWDTVGSAFDTLLAIYTGNAVDQLTAQVSDDNSGGAGTSRVQLQAVAGTVYHIAVDQKFGTQGVATRGVLQLNWHGPDDTRGPVIVEPPYSVATFVGTNVTLSVSVVGAAPLQYEWFHGGSRVTDGGNVSGATTANLLLTDITELDRGVYSVRVSNAFGNTTSPSINLVAAARERVVYVQSINGTPGTTVPVTIGVAADGGEHAFQFSISYDPFKLSGAVVAPGPDLPPNATLETDMSKADYGRVGIKVTLPSGAVLNNRDTSLAVVQLFMASDLPLEEHVPVCLNDQPTPRVVKDLNGNTLTSVYACGVVIALPQDTLTGMIGTDGRFVLELQGMPGAVYEFQFSSDLEHWTSLTTDQNQTGVLSVTDPTPLKTGPRFYRTLRK